MAREEMGSFPHGFGRGNGRGEKWHVFCEFLAGFSHTCSMNCRIFFLRVSHLDILRVLIYP